MTGPKSPGQIDDPSMPFVYLNLTDIYERVTEKHLATIKYVSDNIIEEFDWFLYANDDTYVIMENLRYFLADKCADEKTLYGKIMKYNREGGEMYRSGDNSKGFIQGGSGWLASRESIRLFANTLQKIPKFCVMRKGQWEDQEISNCYRKIDVYPGETRDSENKERFLMDKFEQ